MVHEIPKGYDFLGCNGNCKNLIIDSMIKGEIIQTWACNGKCQILSDPCNGTCVKGYFLNCKNTCVEMSAKKDNRTWLCDGNCQDWSVPCNGRCLEGYFLSCSRTCIRRAVYGMNSYLCGQQCQDIWKPCNDSCEFSSSWFNRKCLTADICYTPRHAINQPGCSSQKKTDFLSDLHDTGLFLKTVRGKM